jgi:preprotein translocase subunit SecE
MLPDYDFSGGVRGKYARLIHPERPNLVNILTTVIAMVYLALLSSPFFIPRSFLYPVHHSPNHHIVSETQPSILTCAVVIFYAILLVFAWLYLLRDLIKQVSLFFRKKPQ